MIPVTKSFLPPMEEYTKQIQRAFNNGWLTNRGELVCELEDKLTDYLELEESKILCTNNGTVPLQIALKLLGNGGEIITTPFSYVATTAAIVWENCTPVFVDIKKDCLTIDASKIEEAITDKTTCILATHVYGNPCDVDAISLIAEKHGLKVIYDAAHCFGVKYKGKSLFEYGDISTCSFHATKIFHTGEGGAIFSKDESLFNSIFHSHNFGHKGPLEFHGLGINGKMSELNAAMGLSVFPYVEEILVKRKQLNNWYFDRLFPNNSISKVIIRENTVWNYSYFAIIFKDEETLLNVEKHLNKKGVFPRRYFYPSLNNLPYLQKKQSVPISEDLASCVLCLPMYHHLDKKIVDKICQIINESIVVC